MPKQPELKLWSLTWPIFIEMFLTFAVFFADSFFLSRISDEVAGTIGALFPVFGISALLLIMMAQAGTSVASQYIGGNRLDMVIPTYMTMVFLNSLIAVVMTAFLYFNAGNIGLWMGFTPQLNVHATAYTEVIALIWLIFGIRTAYSAILSSRGLTFWNMWSAIVLNVSNIGLNYLFLTGELGFPQLGIAGVAWASIISALLAAILGVLIVHKHIKIQFDVQGFVSKFRSLIRSILKIGIPSSLEPVAFQVAQVVMTLMIIDLGIVELGAKTFTSNIMIMGLTWTVALAIGNQIIVAHLMGARKFDAVNQQMHRSLILSIFGGFLIALSIYLFASPLFSIFTDDMRIISLGTTLLLIGLIVDPIRAVNIVAGSALKACGDAKYPAYLAMAVMGFIFIPLLYLFGIHWGYGLVGMWLATLCDESIRAIINYRRWRVRKWETSGVMTEAENSDISA